MIGDLTEMKSLVLAVSAFALFSSAALAQDVLPSKAVNFSDINLGSKEGLNTLRERIVAAANEVCTTDTKNVDPNCRRAVTNRAYAQVGYKLSQRLASE